MCHIEKHGQDTPYCKYSNFSSHHLGYKGTQFLIAAGMNWLSSTWVFLFQLITSSPVGF